MERPNAWKAYDEAAVAELEQLCGDYRAFISENKTERECVVSSVKLAEAAGYTNLDTAIAEGRTLKAGDKVYAVSHNKTLMLVNLGEQPLEQGMNILGAHIDSPRLDLKQNPLYEAGDMAYLDTHYYGGVKAYHWLPPRSRSTVWCARRTAPRLRSAWAKTPPTLCSASPTCSSIWRATR